MCVEVGCDIFRQTDRQTETETGTETEKDRETKSERVDLTNERTNKL